MTDVILAWLVAEDPGARKKISQLLAERDETLATLRSALESQLADVEGDQTQTRGEILNALIECLM